MESQNYLNYLEALTNFNVQELKKLLVEIISTIDVKSKFSNPNTTLGDTKVGIYYCKHCGSVNIIKNGHTKKGKQNFYCKDCFKHFNSATNTILDSSKKPMSTWIKFIECSILKLSLAKTAVLIKTSKNTAFTMRQKFHKAISEYQKSVRLSGEIQMDPGYSKVNLKGTKPHNMPRKSKVRSSSNLRGLSNEQVCFCSATDEYDNTVFLITGTGKEGLEDYQKLMPYFFKPTLIITDSAPGYQKFARLNHLNIDQIPSKFHVSSHYNNLSTINQVHSGVKEYLRGFHGVSTRHLQGYLDFYSLLRSFDFKYGHNEKISEVFNAGIIIDSKIIAKDIFKKKMPVDLCKVYGSSANILMGR